MFKKIPVPTGFSLVKKGRVFLLLKESYKDFLMAEGIEDMKSFRARHAGETRYLSGRRPHPSIPVEQGRRIVARSFFHGGLFRLFTRDIYLFGSRSFHELALTEEIRSSGIPTVEAVGALHEVLCGPVYKACLLSIEVPGARDAIRFFREMGKPQSREELLLKRRVIRSSGLLLSRFHKAGFFHADLQLKNILITPEGPLLIDFDRCYRKPVLSVDDRIKNLHRLNRSAEKWRGFGLSLTRTDRLRFLLAYSEGDPVFRERMGKTFRMPPPGIVLHRFGWRLTRVLAGKGLNLP